MVAKAIDLVSSYVAKIREYQYGDLDFKNHPDGVWYYLCPPEMLYCFQQRSDIVDKMADGTFMERGAKQFILNYRKWEEKLRGDPKYDGLFNAWDNDLKRHFVGFKRWILERLECEWDNIHTINHSSATPLTAKQRQKKISQNKKMFLRKMLRDIPGVLSTQYRHLRLSWDIARNQLFSETITETVCSVIKKVYTAERRKMNLQTLTDLQICAQIFEVLHGNQLVMGSYRKKRAQTTKISPCIDNTVSAVEETIFSCPDVVDKNVILKQLQSDIKQGTRLNR